MYYVIMLQKVVSYYKKILNILMI